MNPDQGPDLSWQAWAGAFALLGLLVGVGMVVEMLGRML